MYTFVAEAAVFGEFGDVALAVVAKVPAFVSERLLLRHPAAALGLSLPRPCRARALIGAAAPAAHARAHRACDCAENCSAARRAPRPVAFALRLHTAVVFVVVGIYEARFVEGRRRRHERPGTRADAVQLCSVLFAGDEHWVCGIRSRDFVSRHRSPGVQYEVGDRGPDHDACFEHGENYSIKSSQNKWVE